MKERRSLAQELIVAIRPLLAVVCPALKSVRLTSRQPAVEAHVIIAEGRRESEWPKNNARKGERSHEEELGESRRHKQILSLPPRECISHCCMTSQRSPPMPTNPDNKERSLGRRSVGR